MNLSKIPQIPGLNFPWKHSGNIPESFQPFATQAVWVCGGGLAAVCLIPYASVQRPTYEQRHGSQTDKSTTATMAQAATF